MDHGHIEQAGAPEEVYRWPASRFVADFLGLSNLLPGRVASVANGAVTVQLSGGVELLVGNGTGAEPGQSVEAVIRAHRVVVRAPGEQTGPNLFDGRVQSVAYLGGMAAYVIEGDVGVHAINTIDRQIFREGEQVQVSIAPEDCVLLDERGLRIGR
jgi:ABC-type Fe3+/spermidine/putrescine transport system ATPase subunit